MPTILFSTFAAAVLAFIVWAVGDAFGARFDLLVTIALSVGVTLVANVIAAVARSRRHRG